MVNITANLKGNNSEMNSLTTLPVQKVGSLYIPVEADVVENAALVPATKRTATTSTTTRKSRVQTPRAERIVRTPKAANMVGVVDQVKRSFAKKNRFATFCGLLLGGFVPSATFTVAHYEVSVNPWLWVLVVGGLIYSAFTVFKWGTVAFTSKVKAVGFVVLIEGTMTFAHTPWLSLLALGLLVSINGIATGCNLVADQKENRGV
jgi:hypothetical protein